ncbi:hypothetical protein Desti_3459 [Desulfomonile tiedjei DSM 6799]|uniref:Uncharacterized protein n=1 Tax=Desulfomonile tiedjei (strain ATCC 49306 / DSM 6799 / DCB-1) TaxID=706587 RepID=I4C970_DESTA|nr:hypothetical protein Desti_3459 [Desulfomonile tiedjei DSM 6799]
MSPDAGFQQGPTDDRPLAHEKLRIQVTVMKPPDAHGKVSMFNKCSFIMYNIYFSEYKN